MPAKRAAAKAARSEQRQIRHRNKNRIALQLPGQPSGKHLSGFKGTKVDEVCFCGKCNPKAVANRGRPIYV